MITVAVIIILVVLVITNRIAGKTYVGKVLLAFDYFVSTLWTRDSGITISSECALYWHEGHPPLFWKWLHVCLNTLQKDHCELAVLHDMQRAQAVVDRLKKAP